MPIEFDGWLSTFNSVLNLEVDYRNVRCDELNLKMLFAVILCTFIWSSNCFSTRICLAPPYLSKEKLHSRVFRCKDRDLQTASDTNRGGSHIWYSPSSYGTQEKRNTMKVLSTSLKFVIGGMLSLRTSRANAVSSVTSTDICVPGSVTTSPKYSNEVVKRLRDNRIYKAVTLPNGLRTLIISDPESQRSAAALDVHVGSLSDPTDIPGMAHFCEHMTFLGTAKYPEEDGFTSFLSTHGGSSNAYTDAEDTVYYFDVNSDRIDEALDRFSQFFIAPLFTAEATTRELNAIDSEHAKNINNDGFRIYQLEKDASNPSHPLNRFATGNKATLETIPLSKGINVRDKLQEFQQKYYSANVMTLSVISNQSVTDIERMVTKYFTAVPNRNIENPSLAWWGKYPPYLPIQSVNHIDIVPIDDVRKVSLVWPIWVQDKQQKQYYQKKKPETIIAHLLGHEGKGSLRSYLVSAGFANGVQASITNDLSDLQSFEIAISLTPDGLKKQKEVVDAVFAYLDLMKNKPIPSYVYDEVVKLSRTTFDYSEKADASDYVSRLVSDMQVYDNPAEYITGSRLFTDPDDCAVRDYLHQLTPQQARILSISKTYESTAKETGRYYGTKYSNYSSEADTIRWNNVHYEDYPFDYPQPNPLIPTNFRLVSESVGLRTVATQNEKLKALMESPKEIRNDDKWSVWYKLDRAFNQPKVYSIISLAINKNQFGPDYVINSKLFISCFLDSINEYLYDASLAGYRLDLSFTTRGIDIVFSGYSDKLRLFIQSIMNYLISFRANESTLNRFKELLQRELSNWKTQQPYSHSSYYLSLATETLQYPIEELTNSLKNSIKSDDLNKFLESLLRQSYGQALIIGNIDEKDSLDIINIVDQSLHFEPLSKNLRSNRQMIEIPSLLEKKKQGYRLSHDEPNDNDVNSATTFLFQLPSRSIRDTVMLELLAEAIEQPFYNSLRTQQQLGYIVSSRARARDGIYSLSFTVQSSIVNGKELTRRIETFVNEEIPLFADMNEETFDQYKQGLINLKQEPDQRLTSHAQRLWAEIVIASIRSRSVTNTNVESITPLFDRDTKEIAELKKLRLNEFQQFVKDFLSIDGKNRRLILSEINAKYRNNNSQTRLLGSLEKSDEILREEDLNSRYEYVDNERSFRDSLPIIP